MQRETDSVWRVKLQQDDNIQSGDIIQTGDSKDGGNSMEE